MWPHLFFVPGSTPSRPQLCIHLSSFLLRVIKFLAFVKKNVSSVSAGHMANFGQYVYIINISFQFLINPM